MRLSFWRTHHDYLNPSRRLLLANHGGWLPRLPQKMHIMQEAWQPYPPETRATSLYTILVALRKVGKDILGPFSPGKGQVKFLIVAVDYFTK